MSITPISLFLMNTYGVNYMVIQGKDNVYRNITIIFSLIGFIVSIFCVPRYSYIGIAITVTAARMVGGLLTYTYIRIVKKE